MTKDAPSIGTEIDGQTDNLIEQKEKYKKLSFTKRNMYQGKNYRKK